MRIVSLLPSATEIVCALGARGELVGRSAECDYPPDVRELPVVMRPRTLDSDRPSGEIDRRVRAARAAGESLYRMDVDLLRRLRPDVLVTQDLCGVCSVTGGEAVAACEEAGVRPEIVSLAPRTLEEVWASIVQLGKAIGRPEPAGELARSLGRRSALAPPRTATRVAVVEWLDPPILAGLWTPGIIASAGATPVGPAEGSVGQRTSWREIAALAPELVVLSPCSFSVARTEEELGRAPVGADAASSLPGRAVYVADEAYFSRPGPRLAEGVDLLRGLLRGATGPFPLPVSRWRPPLREVAR